RTIWDIWPKADMSWGWHKILQLRGHVWCLVRRLAGMEHVPPILEDIMMWFQPMAAKRTVKSVVARYIQIQEYFDGQKSALIMDDAFEL
ncbi:hypothetical protein Tco_1258165, partial [Tanacetum coccineum]